MVRATRFTHPDSVDAWDQWFRWREGALLHDRTIDATWMRVAQAIVPADESEGEAWVRRYVEAFSRWQLLPDERLLQFAGTGQAFGDFDAPSATLNAAAFVTAAGTRQARFDAERFAWIAALAVRLLDDATQSVARGSPAAPLRIGVIGFADALHLLGIDYADPRAIVLGRDIGQALAAGTLQGELDLVEGRGPKVAASEGMLAAWDARGVAGWMIERIARQGVRHDGLTALASQPRLARLANRASDAFDPHAAEPTAATHCSCRILTRDAADATRRILHDAVQPWIDAPIDAGSEPAPASLLPATASH